MVQCYVPILKWKQGERIALRETNEVKDKLCPVFNVTGTMNAETFAKQVETDWGKERPFYLDFHPTFAGNPVNFLNAARLPALIPIISLDKSPAYVGAIGQKAGELSGIALRIQLGDTDKLSDLVYTAQTAKTDEQTLDLIIDLGDITSLSQDIIKTLVKPVCTVLDEAKAFPFRRVVVAGASFPQSLEVPQGQVSTLARLEWALWKEVYKTQPHICFGDYGADDPHDPVYDHQVTMIPTIRYTHEDHWFIVRGILDRNNPYDFSQFHGLSQTLIGLNEYCGEVYSWGDRRIYECAGKTCTGSDGCNHGNMATWVQINTNHHLTYVAHQVASWFSP